MTIKEIIKISKKLKLLYIEDDATSRITTVELLNNFFDFITIAVNGQDGLEKFKEKSFDIILSDINMPKLNGINMVNEIKKIDENIPVLFLSAHNESKFLSEGIRLGVDGYILKPLKLSTFTLVLSKVCEKISLQQEHENYKKCLEQEVKKQTKELDVKLHFDELTGLYSRYSFFEDIKDINTPIVFIIDINKFKIINEIYGTAVGSIVLKKFAEFLKEFTRDSTYKVYRLSGDEFILRDDVEYINPEKYEEDIVHFYNLLNDFKVDIENDTISIEVTMGLSTSQHDAFECAKIALEYAKLHKRPYEMYSTAIDKRNEEQDALVWKNRTKAAIADNRVVAVYQPIVDRDGEILKYETLIRLKDSKNEKLIPPSCFLEIAIKTGLYSTLSSHVIFEALHLADTSSYAISINFTYGDIKNETLLNEIEAFFKTSVKLGNRIVFEITESESIADYVVVKNFIKRFRAYGIGFAIDDFGSGFSNFEYILEIEPDYLKIDGSLIKSIDTDTKAHILVGAIVEFSHKLGIKIIAEHVHSKEIFDMLKALNVDEYQGFYFSEPLEFIG